MAKRAKATKTTQIIIKISPSLKQKIEKRAELKDTNLSELIRLLIENELSKPLEKPIDMDNEIESTI